MNEIMTIIALDVFLALLLVVTIIYCFKLNGRIRLLQDSKDEFSKLIERFDVTTSRAQQSIEELQAVSKKVNEELSGRLDKANFLADDLAFMIERGSKLAHKIDSPTPKRPEKRGSALDEAPRKKPVMRGKSGSAAGPVDDKKERKRASLESMLTKVAEKRDEKASSAVRRAKGKGRVNARLRSKAEQELFDAMKSGDQ